MCYAAATVVNLLLRFSWRASRLPGLRTLHSANLILLLEVAEVCRRAMWNVIRIEWEMIVQQDKLLAVKHEDDTQSKKQAKTSSSNIHNSSMQ
jgi:hypothetical protein